MTNILGPDVSFYQDDNSTPQQIDFAKMKANAEFVIIRAGQNLWPDPDFEYNWKAARDAGLPRGCYWFYDSRADPKRQADLLGDILSDDLGELPIFFDAEESYGGPYKGWQNWYTFLERLKSVMWQAHEIGVYTAYYYWRDNAPSSLLQPSKLAYFKQYPLWIANYGVSKPKVPAPWGEDDWLFWQFTETGDGKKFGVESNGIDLNWFNGDKAAFTKRFGLDTAQPAPEPQPDEPQPRKAVQIVYDDGSVQEIE